jgi:hypothetical protein
MPLINLTELISAPAVAGTDVMYAVLDPAGARLPRKTTVVNLLNRRPAGTENGFVVTPPTGWGDGTETYGSEQAFLVLSDSDAPLSVTTEPTSNITATTNATPVAVTTSPAHGYSTGDVVRITGTGIGALDNRWWKITVTSSTTFTLNSSTAPGSTSATGYVFASRNPILLRMDGLGSIGMGGGIHLATGLRGKSGQTFAPGAAVSLWITPSYDAAGIIITNPSTTHWPGTPISAFMSCLDVRADPDVVVFEVTAAGQAVARRGLRISADGSSNALEFGTTGDAKMYRGAAASIYSDSTVVARAGFADQAYIGSFFGSAGLIFGSAIDTGIYRQSVGIIHVANAFRFPEITDPAAPAANHGLLYFRDNGAGKTQACIRFPTGAMQVIATEP